MKNNKFDCLFFTNCGKVRRENQDAVLLRQIETNHGDVVFAVVADGMGGTENGHQASNILIDSLTSWWDENLEKLGEEDLSAEILEQSLRVRIEQVNKEITELKEKSGTTMSLLFLWNNQYLILHAGDSRIYFLRDIGIDQITRDETWYEQELEKGTLNQHDVPLKKMKSVLVNAIGVKKDYKLSKAYGSLENIYCGVLCSDGAYHYIESDDLEEILKPVRDINIKKAEFSKILQNSEATDNYSMIIIQKKKSWCNIGNFWRRD